MRKVYFNRTLSFLMWLQALCVVFTACSESGKDEPTPEPSKPAIEDFKQGNMDFTEQADSKTFTFTANADWTVSAAPTGGEAWCTLSPTNGKAGAQTVAVNVAENTGYDDRSVTVTLKVGNESKQFVVTQKQKDALLLTSDKFEVEQKGGTIQVEVKANVNYTATIGETCKEWIKAGSNTRALSTTTKIYTIAANEENEKREGTITFTDGTLTETVHVYQAGGEIILLSKDEFYADAKGEELTVELRSNCDYEVVMPQVNWVQAVNTRASSSHTLRYTILANDTYDTREAKIIFRSKKNTQIADTLTITQGQKDAIILSQKEITAKAEGETIEVKLSANVDYEVMMPTDANWITTATTRGLTEHTLYYKVEKNEADDSRSAKITFSNKKNGLEEVLTVIQKGNRPTPQITLTIQEAGTLGNYIDNDRVSTLDGLKIVGELNGTDFNVIQRMKMLKVLDLSQAKIVKGGDLIKFGPSRNPPRYGYEVGDNTLDAYMLPRGIQYFYPPTELQYIGGYTATENLAKNMYSVFSSYIDGSEGVYSNLKEIVIPTKVRSIGESAFAHTSLTAINIHDNITKIGDYAFIRCQLRELSIGSNVKKIGEWAFSENEKLSNITIPEGVEEIGEGAFSLCN